MNVKAIASRRRFLEGSAAVAGVAAASLSPLSALMANAARKPATQQENVRHFTIKNPKTWYQHTDRQIFLGDVLDEKNSDAMSVGFARYQEGETNEWTVTYDEALIVTKGAYTVHSGNGAKTAKAGEVIFLTAGTKVVYEGAEDDTEVVYVTYPHWFDAQLDSKHADLLDAFHPVSLSTKDR